MISHTILEKKLPPFSGLVLVVMLLITISWLTGNVVLFGTRAATGGVPQKIQITNISDTSFTVVYQTDEPVLGSLRYGTNDSLGNVGLDDRDQLINKPTEHRMHHITVKNLTPGSKYVFEIASGDGTYKNNNRLYEVSTAPALTAKTTESALKGQVTLKDGSIPIEGIVQVATDTSQTLTALLQPDGSYQIPFKTLRTRDLIAWAPLTATTQLRVQVATPTEQSLATLLTGQSNPAPLMVLSKNYDFSLDSSLAADEQATESAAPTVNLPVPVDTTQVSSPTITVPEKDQKFNDPQPMFSGKALPNSNVAIVMQAQQPIEAIVQADANGNWEFKPAAPLEPGNYIIMVGSADDTGAIKQVTQSFSILTQGSQFVEPSISPPLIQDPLPASPSAALPEPSPTEEPTPTPTNTPTPTFPIASSSAAPIDGNANPPVPNSGSSTLLFGFIGILLSAGVGTLLFFFL